MIVYQILTLNTPFPKMDSAALIANVIEGQRPKLLEDIPTSYCSLIQSCWENDPNDRPTFDQILDELKSNPDFITDTVDEEEFMNYQEYLDSYQSSFNIEKNRIKLEDFLKEKKSKIEKVKKNESNLTKIVEKEVIYEQQQKKNAKKNCTFPLSFT